MMPLHSACAKIGLPNYVLEILPSMTSRAHLPPPPTDINSSNVETIDVVNLSQTVQEIATVLNIPHKNAKNCLR